MLRNQNRLRALYVASALSTYFFFGGLFTLLFVKHIKLWTANLFGYLTDYHRSQTLDTNTA